MKNLYNSRYLLLLFLVFIGLNLNLNAQSIVVSEYYNATDPKDEWIELLVVKDNLNISGMIVRDNVENFDDPGNPNKWMGGVMFNNHSLWKNLRAGTVIVINSRGNAVVDDDPTDGYIEIGAENDTYFSRICFNCIEPNWAFDALVIAEKGDLVQILDNDQSTNIHTLGHMIQPPKLSGDFYAITKAKLARYSECPIGSSVCVIGDKLESYYLSDGGFDSGNSITSCNNTNITKGLANTTTGKQSNINQRFWRTLREPKWNSPVLLVQQTNNTIKLSWNKPLDDVLPTDKVSGYLITKVKKQFSANPTLPEDGTEYNVGEQLGFATVVGNVIGSNILEYIDTTKTDCGDEYIYTIYGFRFNNGGKQFNALTGRGRSYQTQEGTYATVEFIKEAPPSFIIETREKVTNYCDLDSAIIINDIADSLRSLYQFSWYKDGQLVSKSSQTELKDSLIIKKSGKYRLDIVNSLGCLVSSNDLQINITKIPKIVLRNDRDASFLTKDTTIYLCKGETFIFNSSGNGEKKEWFKDGQSVSPNSFTYSTKSSGTYKVVYSNQNACFDSSAAITLKFLDYDISFTIDTLKMTIGPIANQVDGTFTIKNNKPDLIELDDYNLRIEPLSNYTILDKPPYKLPASGTLTVNVRFSLNKDGKLPGAIIITDPCKNRDTLHIDGQKIKAKQDYTLSMEQINFTPTLVCDVHQQDTILFIKNVGNIPMDILSTNINSPFFISNSTLPISLQTGDSVEVKVSFNETAVNSYSDILKIQAKTIQESFTIEIPLSAEITTPKFAIIPKIVDFKTLSDCEITKDTTINITNTGVFDIDFTNQFLDPNVEILGLPFAIKSGEVKSVIIRFKPTTSGNFAINENISASPCDITRDIQIMGAKQGITYSLVKDTLDFGTIINCNPNIEAKKTNTLNIQIPNNLSVTILDINITDGFSSNLTVGEKLSSSNEIVISQNDKTEGEYTGKITLTLDPCNYTLEFYFKAKRADYNLDLADTIYFAPVYQFETSTNYLPILNNNQFPVSITAIDGLNTKFRLRNGVLLPITINENSTDTLWIEYTNPKYEQDTLNVILKSEVPCGQEKEIILIAESRRLPVPPGNIQGRISGSFTAVSGQILTYPVTLESASNYDLTQTDLSKTEFVITYNPTLLIPKGVTIGNALRKDSAITSSFSEEVPGKLKVTLLHKNFLSVEYGAWIDVSFISLIGNTQSTKIHLDSVNITSLADITYTGIESGEYTLIGECNANGERNFSLTTATPIRLESGNLVSQSSVYSNSLIFESLSNETSLIQIFNQFGEIIDTPMNQKLQLGIHKQVIDFSNFSSGLYFIKFQNGIRIEYYKFLLVK